MRNNTPEGHNIPIDWIPGQRPPNRWLFRNDGSYVPNPAWNVKSRQPVGSKNIKWAVAIGSSVYANPVIANGKLFIGTNNGSRYVPRYTEDLGVMLCFDEESGDFLWQYSSPKLASGRANDWPLQGMPSTAAVSGDRLWAVTNRCEVICLDTEGFRDGENDGPFAQEENENTDEADIVWKLDMLEELGVFPHNLSNCSPLLADGLVFVCTSNGVDEAHLEIPSPRSPSFIAVNAATGKLVWEDRSPGENILHSQWASPSFAVFGGQAQVIFPGGDGWLYAFDAKGDGEGHSKLLWKFDCNPKDAIYELGAGGTRNEIIGFACIYGGRVYVAVGQDPEHSFGVGHLWCIDPMKKLDGSDVSPELVVNSNNEIVKPRRLHAIDASQNERVAANPHSALVWHYCQVDCDRDGQIEFSDHFNRTLSTSAIKDDILYISDLSGYLHCLDAKTGESYWTYDLLASVWSSPLIVDGKVYVTDEDGNVTIFRHSRVLQPGEKPLAVVEMPWPIYSTPVVANNVLYIATRDALYAIQSD